MGKVETVEHHHSKGLTVHVYMGKQQGSASTSDFSASAIQSTVIAACAIAQATNPDPYAGLADAHLMATSCPQLALYYPWSLEPSQAIDLAKECEAMARTVDKRIINSEGTNVSSHLSWNLYANTHGFSGFYPTSMHSISCHLIGQDGNRMQQDGSYTISRDPNDLLPIDQLAIEAGKRTVRRLNARTLQTCRTPVLFVAEVAKGLIASFLSAISGGALYRRASFLVDQLGQSIFAEHVTISECPYLLKGFASAPFDEEGVATKERMLVVDGILQGYLLDSYSARRLGMATTGNAGGAHNIVLKTHDIGLEGLLKKMDKGLLVTEVMGQGVNLVTGDYSQGAAGFWVENGQIQYPVEEITLAGHLREMYHQIVAVGNDVDRRGSILTGSLLIDSMVVAGNS
jgi:PmbA protein